MRTQDTRRVPKIGEIVQKARAFNLWRLQEVNAGEISIAEVVDLLLDELEARGCNYLLVGALALLQYVEGRNSELIELIVDPADLEEIPGIAISSHEGDLAHAALRGIQLELHLTHSTIFEKVLRDHATSRRFGDRQIPCATVEGLLLLKLYALPSLYRQGNYARVGLYENDVATLLQEFKPDLDPLFAELEPHLLATDLKSLRQIVAEIRQRLERFELARESE